jgi:Xaa-Pro aminopeptidase
MKTNEKLTALRRSLNAQQLDAYIVPSSDPHQSEYVADLWKTRIWLSGFSGSMGYVTVTPNHAGVWTDSRYWLQCETQIAGTDWEMFKQTGVGEPDHLAYLVQNLAQNSRVGVEGALFSVAQIRQMKRMFAQKNIELVTNAQGVSDIWKDRPDLPKTPVFEHEIRFAGKTREEKLAAIREKMTNHNADFHLVSTLDDIGWTLNLRGSDVECNPVFIAYMVVATDRSFLFVEPSQIDATLRRDLETAGVFLKKYTEIKSFLSELPQSAQIAIDINNTNHELYTSISANIIEVPTFSSAMKAVKNATEMSFIRTVMVKDGVALLKAFRWLEKTLLERPVSEYEMACMIAQYRSDQPHYFGESFSAIIGYKANGAIVHYKPEADTSAFIEREGILLLDSGGQYADGTTDITRTIALSPPTAAQRQHFTAVLRGHIALACAQFPAGTRGVQLDILARLPLWQMGLNYGHGTGHGVGFFMNVHEPPQGFVSGLNARGTTPHEIGMLSSNEPGFYEEGAYGIRIENLVLVQEAEKTAYGQFLCFETVTLFPIDTTLVETAMLLPQELAWLNAYHARVYAQLSPFLSAEESAWLKEKCLAIG